MLTATHEERYACYYYTYVVARNGRGSFAALKQGLAELDVKAVIPVEPAVFYPRVRNDINVTLPDGETVPLQIQTVDDTFVLTFRGYVTGTETLNQNLERMVGAIRTRLSELVAPSKLKQSMITGDVSQIRV
jgi:hypothetical protein